MPRCSPTNYSKSPQVIPTVQPKVGTTGLAGGGGDSDLSGWGRGVFMETVGSEDLTDGLNSDGTKWRHFWSCIKICFRK